MATLLLRVRMFFSYYLPLAVCHPIALFVRRYGQAESTDMYETTYTLGKLYTVVDYNTREVGLFGMYWYDLPKL